ncbi:MAG TPA: carbohydrate-binding family 9-like protein [Fibrobacteraceae bacterium]|nr:carbohydrate-binding family 9-like protein [Fibrobacteraceae bacterium]
MAEKQWRLQSNPAWPQCKAALPEVLVFTETQVDAFRVRWQVHEQATTFRCEVTSDGGPCWQDSCVEIFLRALDGSHRYCNFEFNAKGFCLAASGPNRFGRQEIKPDQYTRIQRQAGTIKQSINGGLEWSLQVEIPVDLFYATTGGDLRNFALEGNLYKCGDQTEAPHWLSAFPVTTLRPDFHQPGCFKRLD